MRKLCFVCLTSGKTAIFDGFVDFFINARILGEDVFAIKSAFVADARLDAAVDNILNIKYDRRALQPVSFLTQLSSVRKFLASRGITDVLFYSTTPFGALLALALPRSISVHFWLHDPVCHTGERIAFKILKKISDSVLLRRLQTGRLLLASQFLKGQFSARHGNQLPNVSVIPFPYISSLVCENSASFRDIDYIFFGRIEEYKGLDVLVQAMELWEGPEIKVLLCGAGVGRVVTKGNRRVLVDKVDRFLDESELKCLIARSRVAVFPYKDATGTQAIQVAAANGCVVVATSVGSFPEILNSLGDFAVTARPGDSRSLLNALRKAYFLSVDHEEIRIRSLSEFDPKLAAERLIEELY